jgi:hypothetical protein
MLAELLELRQQTIDIAVFITRHLCHSGPGPGAACDGGQDADTAQGPRPPAPARRSTAALRSAGSDQRRLPPARPSPRREKGDPLDLTPPAGENRRPPAWKSGGRRPGDHQAAQPDIPMAVDIRMFCASKRHQHLKPITAPNRQGGSVAGHTMPPRGDCHRGRRIATAAEATSWQIGRLSTSGGNEHPKVVRSTQQGGEDPDGTKWQPLAVARLRRGRCCPEPVFDGRGLNRRSLDLEGSSPELAGRGANHHADALIASYRWSACLATGRRHVA